MNDIDKLISNAVDGLMTEEEAQRLDAMLALDDQARQRYAQQHGLEADLQALDEGLDVSEVTMQRLCRELAVVRRPIENADVLSHRPRLSLRWRWVAGIAAMAALWTIAGIAGWVWQPTDASFATLVRHGSGELVIERTGARQIVQSLEPLNPGDVIHAQTQASITYADGTRVDVGPGAEIKLSSGPGEAKSLTLTTGCLSADVAKQPAGRPMQFHTPQAVATVLGTQLDLAIRPTITRLSVTEGHVRLMRRNDSATVDVPAGHVAYAGAAMELAARPPRIAEGLIALYRFDEGDGDVVHDRSGLAPALPLMLKTQRKDAAVWLPEGGLRLDHRAMLVSEGPAAKITDAVRASNALTLEAWIDPAVAQQRGPARIITLSNGSQKTNFTLGHGGADPRKATAQYTARIRTTRTDPVGGPGLETPPDSVTAGLSHVVMTRNAYGVRVIYLNGERVAEDFDGGDFSHWIDGLPMTLGDDVFEDRSWRGTFRLVAVYDQALTAEQVRLNHAAGPFTESWSDGHDIRTTSSPSEGVR